MWQKYSENIEYPNVDSGLLTGIWSAVPFAKPFFRKQCRYEDHRERVAKRGEGREGSAAETHGVRSWYFVPAFLLFFFVGI